MLYIYKAKLENKLTLFNDIDRYSKYVIRLKIDYARITIL